MISRLFLRSFILFLCLAMTSLSAAEFPPQFKDCADCPQMTVIHAGEFLMGSTGEEIARDLSRVHDEPSLLARLGMTPSDRDTAERAMAYERPQHSVRINKRFAFATTQVTTQEFAAFVSETGYHTGPCWMWHVGRPIPPVRDAWSHPNFTSVDNQPVVCVTWADANAYIRWLNTKVNSAATGPYRLPSEAEWEYAARAGTRTAYWWGNDVGIDHELCNGCNRADHFTVAVGEFLPNPFGLFDMLGNASQWTQDCWHPSYEGAPEAGEPWLSGDCGRRVIRGGNWKALAWFARASTRSPERADETWNSIGFRVVKDL